MRSLGCKQVISMENFRSPNFELVADVLFWLLKRYDPDTAVVDDIDTPQERVQFLQDVAQAMLVKGRVKLNIKRLYTADGKAVRELLKVADLLYKASAQAELDPGDLARKTDAAMMELGALEKEVAIAGQLIADITHAGTDIYDCLGQEAALKEARQAAIAKQTDRADVELAIQEAIHQLTEDGENLQSGLNDLAGQKQEAAEKMRRKRTEFERTEQRLMQLKHVRAPYQDELDGLEEELSAMYGVYLTKFRCLEYLEAELAKIRRGEEERMRAEEAKLERMRRKLADHELKIVRGLVSINERDLPAGLVAGAADDSDDSATIPSSPTGLRNVSAERPSAPAHGARGHGSLMPTAQDVVGSEDDDFDRDDSTEFERFDAAAQDVLDRNGGSGDGDDAAAADIDALLDDDEDGDGSGQDDLDYDDDF